MVGRVGVGSRTVGSRPIAYDTNVCGLGNLANCILSRLDCTVGSWFVVAEASPSSCSVARTGVVPEVSEVAVSVWVEMLPWLSAAVTCWVTWVLLM